MHFNYSSGDSRQIAKMIKDDLDEESLGNQPRLT